MLNFFKTKTFKVGSFVAVFALASALTASAVTYMPIKTGGVENVKAIQTLVGTTADGKAGPMTKAAIKVWQAANGLVADGAFGPASAAKANMSSTTTTTTTTTTAGCPAGALFNTMTGASCTGTTTTTTTSGTNGYLTDLSADSSNRVSTVYEADTDKVVAGFRATARLASQNVTRVRVTMVNNNTSSSANLGKYITSASLWMGSTKLATMPVSMADRGTSDDVYTFNFTGFNAAIAKDSVARFYLSLNANGSLDSTDATNSSWTVSFTAGGVSASSPDGTYDTYPATAISQSGILFGKFSSSGVKATVALATTNPNSQTVSVNSNTSTTTGQTLLKFTVKATNTDLTIRKLPIQVTVSDTNQTLTNVQTVINTLKVYRGTEIVDSLSPSSAYQFTAGSASNPSGTLCTDSTATANDLCAFFFSNLSNPSNVVKAGETAEFTVVADLKGQNSDANYTDGTTVSAAFVNADALLSANFSVQDTNGDQLTNASSSIRLGSAVGNTMTLRANGVNVVMGTPSYSTTTATSGDVTSVTYVIPLAVTAFGNTQYIGQTASNVATAGASDAFAFVFQNSSAPSSSVIATAQTVTLSTSNAAVETNGFRLDSGTTKNFTMTVTLTTPNTVNNSYRVAIKQIRTFTEGGLVTGSNSTLLPVESYQTDYKFINN